jgi:SWIM zinc finger
MSAMTSTAVYRYRGASEVRSERGQVVVDLETSGGSDPHHELALGFARHPFAAARSLLVVADVAATRFWTPPNVVTARLRAADPVVTAGPDGLRFESFSICAGVYCRFDLDASGFDGTVVCHGTTNVDVNAPLRAALARVSNGDPLLLRVGSDELAVSNLEGRVVEKQVPLPERWVRGFAEVGVQQSTLAPLVTMQPAPWRQFLASMPTRPGHSVGWVVPTGQAVRWSTRDGVGAVAAGGLDRLRSLRALAPFAEPVTVYGDGAGTTRSGVTGWVVEVPGGRVSLVLSPGPARGFSGEGALISALLNKWTGSPDVEPNMTALDCIEQAALGRVGYDLHRAGFFERMLPFDRSAVAPDGSRLAGAEALVTRGAVQLGPGDACATVTNGSASYQVRLVDEAWRCTCPWWGRHSDERGPCKHVLAAVIELSCSRAH